jgi:hypothetical protein
VRANSEGINMVIIILGAILLAIIGGSIFLMAGIMFLLSPDTGALIIMLLGLAFFLLGIILLVPLLKKMLKDNERKKRWLINQKKNTPMLLKTWNPENWVDYTKHIYKVSASISGNYDSIDKHWNPKDMDLTIRHKKDRYSMVIDFNTCMDIYNDAEGTFKCSLQDKHGVHDIVFLYYKKFWYFTKSKIDPEDMIVLIEETERRKNERLKREIKRAKGRQEHSNQENSRETIPEDVQIFVWNRDGGKCVKCGSNKNLEFDHIIPLSKGGNNTSRNLQLLCESCNRAKGAKIGG